MQPNFFIVGGAKCGTTNMSYYLDEHPQVFMSELNEPYYFARLDIPENFKRESMIKDYKKYLELFKKAKNHRAVGEASSVYLSCPHSASEIKNTFPDSKIIISIRDPIERAHASYFSYKFMNLDKRSFTGMLDWHENQIKNSEFFIDNILEPGFYSKHIKRFQENFSSDKIKIIIFEEYVKNTIPTINSILAFLGIDEKIEFDEQPKGAYRVPKNKISKLLLENATFRKTATKLIPTVTRQNIGDKYFVKQTKKPPMLQQERERLKKIYESEVRELEVLLGKKLPWDDFHVK